MGIGENLKRIRESKGITNADLVRKLGITHSMLSQIERGTKTLSLPLAKEISDILGCRIEDLVETDSKAS